MKQKRGAERQPANPIDDGAIERAAAAIAAAEGLVVAAGAGMGVDSGLPDFRGREGFWRAYPKLAQRRLDFESIANPAWFDEDPELAWGFYGHRLNLYRQVEPHPGCALLSSWAARMAHGAFVVTSNVDGQFQKAGFLPERIAELHGSIHHAQCQARCGAEIFAPPSGSIEIDDELHAEPPLPACPRCGGLARPNILMFDDFDWDARRAAAQRGRLKGWLAEAGRGRMVVVECGAGGAIATVRRTSERLAAELGATLVRINPREAEVPKGQISITQGALEALRAIDARLHGMEGRAE